MSKTPSSFPGRNCGQIFFEKLAARSKLGMVAGLLRGRNAPLPLETALLRIRCRALARGLQPAAAIDRHRLAAEIGKADHEHGEQAEQVDGIGIARWSTTLNSKKGGMNAHHTNGMVSSAANAAAGAPATIPSTNRLAGTPRNRALRRARHRRLEAQPTLRRREIRAETPATTMAVPAVRQPVPHASSASPCRLLTRLACDQSTTAAGKPRDGNCTARAAHQGLVNGRGARLYPAIRWPHRASLRRAEQGQWPTRASSRLARRPRRRAPSRPHRRRRTSPYRGR